MLKSATIFLLLLIITTFNTNAQNVDDLSSKELQNFVKQAQASGLSEEQLMAAAAAKGYTASDIAKFKDKILKAQANKQNSASKTLDGNRAVDSTDIELDTKVIKETLTSKKEEEKRLKIFGLNIFNNRTLNFEPNLKIATPKNYVLGTDDELSIDISGYAFAHYSSKVSSEGTIKIENLSPIYVNGQTIEQAKEKITQRLKTLYGGLSNNGSLTADITLTKIRSIKINVIGEVVFPGTYTVPSLATAINLLYSSGGPTDIGTLRNIEIFRNGKLIRNLDLYDYLLRGDLKDNILLHDQDVIRVPYVDLTVALNGAVRNPKIFELKKGESLKTLLDYAGGFNEMAYSKSLRVDRVTQTEKKIVTIDKNEFSNFIPQKGDIFKVDSISNKFENSVYIEGAINRKGAYEFEHNMTLQNLISKAEGLRDDAYKNRILIKRERPNLDPEIIRINGNDLSIVVSLQKNDTIYVKSFDDLRQKRTIQIDGEVNKPSIIDYAENLTVSDVIMLADGLKYGANASKIEIARRVKEDLSGLTPNQTIQIIQISIDENLKLSENEANFIVKPFDRIYVRKLARYEEQKNVTISGEINYPGPYSLKDKTERISDLIQKSGGIKDQADLGSAKFTRDGKQIGIDLKKVTENNSDANNLLLISGDVLDIPRKKETVTISGNVYNPITVPYQPGFKLMDYVSLAGGANDSAFVQKIYVKYGNGRLNTTKKFLGFKIFPRIESGSEIIIPVYRKQRWTPAERIAVSSAVISIATVVISIILRVVPSN